MRIAAGSAGGLTVSVPGRRRSGMPTSLFDTLEAADALARAGLPEPQAKAIAATMRKAVSEGVATKSDVAELRAELKGEIAAVKAELWAVKWVLGFVLAVVLAMAARLFGIL